MIRKLHLLPEDDPDADVCELCNTWLGSPETVLEGDIEHCAVYDAEDYLTLAGQEEFSPCSSVH